MCESYFGAVKRTVAGIEVSRSGQFIRSMFRIGCIGFGGGSALIPVIEKEIVERQGIDTKQNIDKDVIVASITPGALPVEIAASIGRRAFGSKGMIAGAVMFALPGTVMTVLLVAVLSMFQEKILSIVNLISVGVSVFIVYLLLCYIRNMLKECKEAGRGRICRAVFLMFLVFAMSFVISSVEILALFFFAIFFTRGNYQKTNLLFLMGITAAYIMCHGKGMLLAGSKWHILIDTGMLLLGSYGMIRNIADTGFHGKKDWKVIGKDVVNKKIEKVIFPAIIDYLRGEGTRENMQIMRDLILLGKFPVNYSLTLLNEIVSLYDSKDFDKMLDFYEDKVASIGDASTRLNLDVLLKILLQSASIEQRQRASDYARKCEERVDSRAKNNYKALIEALAK